MNTTTKLFLFVIGAVTLVTGTNAAYAQITPPPLEDAANNTAAADSKDAATVSLGKVTIQISQTEQIVLDLPLKSDNKYQVVPIK